jgi:hypothetical protein
MEPAAATYRRAEDVLGTVRAMFKRHLQEDVLQAVLDCAREQQPTTPAAAGAPQGPGCAQDPELLFNVAYALLPEVGDDESAQPWGRSSTQALSLRGRARGQ